MIWPLHNKSVNSVDVALLTRIGASVGFFLLIDLLGGFKAFLLPFLNNLI
jgi:hypothetical protein